MAKTAERDASADLGSLRRTLARFHVDEGRLARSVAAYLEAHGSELLPSRVAENPLTAEERAALASVGVDPDTKGEGHQPVIDGLVRHAVLVATGLDVAEAARRLAVHPNRIRQRIRERSLLGVRDEDGRSWRVLAFQLTPAGELPGLSRVLPSLPRDLDLVSVVGFFTTPQPDLEGPNGEATTPITWLATGGDPETVRELAAAL